MNEKPEQNWYAFFTMDCIPPGGHRVLVGPSSWRAAERSIEDFSELVLESGWRPTLFVNPACLEKLGEMLLDLEGRGARLGLLCHPQLSGYQSFLGAYRVDVQREIVGGDRRSWEEHMGKTVETIRPGFFSANDYTFQAFCMEGFRQGSCSLPGKVDRNRYSDWRSAPLYPHHTDPLSKNETGSMEFFEIPVGSDIAGAEQYERGMNFFVPPHLRIEEPHIHENARSIFKAIIEAGRTAREGGLVPFGFLTSNAVDWREKEAPYAEHYLNLLSLLKRMAEEHGSSLRPGSAEELHALADKHI